MINKPTTVNSLFALAIVFMIAGCDSISSGTSVTVTDVGDVEGTVTDSATGNAILGVTVQIGDKSNTTGISGVFTLQTLTVGSRTITASKAEYNTYTDTVTIYKGTTVILNIQLTLTSGSSGTEPPIDSTPVDPEYSVQITEAAQSGLSAFLEMAKVGTETAACHFADQDELISAKLGAPYHVFAIYNPGESSQITISRSEWTFPIVVNNEYRCMMKVERRNDQWQAVSFGYSGYASWLQAAETSHPSTNVNDRQILRIWFGHPYDALMINSYFGNVQQASFILSPPAAEWLNYLPEYSQEEWKYNDPRPVPVLTYTQLYTIFLAHP